MGLDTQDLSISAGGTLDAPGALLTICAEDGPTPDGFWLARGLTAIEVSTLNGAEVEAGRRPPPSRLAPRDRDLCSRGGGLRASLALGQAALALCGVRRWSWLAPAVGLALVCAVGWGTVRLPGTG